MATISDTLNDIQKLQDEISLELVQPRQRVRKRTGITLRPSQILAAQLRHIRAAPFLLDARLCLLKQGLPVERLARRHHEGKRPQGVAALGRRQVGGETRRAFRPPLPRHA